MAARTRRVTMNDKWREKLQVSAIFNRLNGCAMGTVEMTSAQLKAAELILRKVVPDLSRVESTGVNGGPVQFEVVLRPHENRD
jgi:hypothetical protein